MRKRKLLLVIAIIAVVLMTTLTPAVAETTSSIKVMVNNQFVTSNAPPSYFNGTLLVTAKELLNSLGGTFNYDNSSMIGSVKKGENELEFRLDDNIAKLNGKYIQAPAPFKIMNCRFMVPAQLVSEKLGAEVYMNTYKNILMVFQPVDGKIMYKVMSGDSLWVISKTFGTAISTIKQLNNLVTDTLYIGQKLIIKNSTAFNTIIAAQTTKSATLRSGAGTGYTATGYLQVGVNISITGKNGDWYKVITPIGNGYIYYSIVGINQDMTDTTPDSGFFNSEIAVDASKDFITYTKYTVQKGDTIWSIAEKSNVLDFELAAANNISLSAMLYIGQLLTVPVHNIAVKSALGPQYGEVLDWFKEAQYVFPIGKTGKFIDMETGKSFMAQRTMGATHSDTEVLTAQDAQIMKEIFGGTWNWNRRPFILEVDGRRFAISVAGMPHAGIDGVPYLQNIDGRSDNWGYGPNYDRISGNGMNGHFDVYFLNCLKHKDNNLDPAHQYRVLVAGGLQ